MMERSMNCVSEDTAAGGNMEREAGERMSAKVGRGRGRMCSR